MSISSSETMHRPAPSFAAALALTAGCALLALPGAADARKRTKVSEYAPVLAPERAAAPANGAIFQPANGYAPLTSGARAAMVGDLVTITLVERTQAAKTSASNTDRSGRIGLAPPTSGPLALFTPGEAAMSGGATFDGKGAATQSNQLRGELSVTVAEVYPNGTMLVRGEKLLTLNRGDEHVRISGIVRAADIGPDNRIPSTRVADARIAYSGKGDVARASRQGWLSRFFSIVSPF